MSLGALSVGERNLFAGDFGEAWVHAVAAGCGHLHEKSSTVDKIKADVLLTLDGEADGWRNPAVLVQVKTSVDLRDHDDGSWAYDLDLTTYDVLRHPKQATRRILAVVGVSEDGETVRLVSDGTLLVGQTSWVCLEDLPASSNTSSQVVMLPKANRLDEDGLLRMLSVYGIPRSSPVPDVDEWGG